MNIGALGNIVPQLHIHHLVRLQTDPAWPGPVWGKLPARPYSQDELHNMVQQLKQHFSNTITWATDV